MQDVILDLVQAPHAPLLGEGMEAWVYALDDERVLRIYKQHTAATRERLIKLRNFYASLDEATVPFAVPHIFNIEVYQGTVYTIDRRLPGRSPSAILIGGASDQKNAVLQSYMNAAGHIARLRPPFDYYGEVLRDQPLRAATWPEFIVRKTNRAYQVYQAGFDQEVPGMQHILDFIRDEVVAVADISQALLVHGDFNAANVLITDNVVSAVADFNDLMVAGDPLMDFTSSIIGFLEAEDGLLPEDGQFLLEQIVAQSRPDSKRAIHLYRLYYALVFGSSCKDNDPRTYAWSIKTLREHAAGSYRY